MNYDLAYLIAVSFLGSFSSTLFATISIFSLLIISKPGSSRNVQNAFNEV
ncbi:hypothetical protein [Staphylococcus felis]|nr:hypothetical protein [Staphylococcus felis]UXR86347.1 hypothetical protein MUA17_09860 [Staphylococcus felis]